MSIMTLTKYMPHVACLKAPRYPFTLLNPPLLEIAKQIKWDKLEHRIAMVNQRKLGICGQPVKLQHLFSVPAGLIQTYSVDALLNTNDNF